MHHYVYKITNIENGHFYIGIRSSILSPEDDPYMGSGTHIKRAIKKQGKENFKKEVIHRDVPDRETLFKLEAELVTIELINRKDCYNLKEGGVGGHGLRHSQETKTKISEYQANRPKSPEMIEKLKAKKRTPEQSQRMKDGWKKRAPMSEQQKEKLKAAWVKRKQEHPCSEETKQKLSAIHKGKTKSKETRLKMSEAQKLARQQRPRETNPETGRKISEGWKRRMEKIRNDLDLTKVSAKYEDGLLTVTVPQRPETQPVTVEIL